MYDSVVNKERHLHENAIAETTSSLRKALENLLNMWRRKFKVYCNYELKTFLVKRVRAVGGCLGIDRRRRTCYLRKASGNRKGF